MSGRTSWELVEIRRGIWCPSENAQTLLLTECAVDIECHESITGALGRGWAARHRETVTNDDNR